MNADTIDIAVQLRRMSLQRWSFAFAAVVAATAAPIVTSTAAGSGQSPFVLALVVGLTVASIAQPDSHVAIAIPVVVVWHWIASTARTGDHRPSVAVEVVAPKPRCRAGNRRRLAPRAPRGPTPARRECPRHGDRVHRGHLVDGGAHRSATFRAIWEIVTARSTEGSRHDR